MLDLERTTVTASADGIMANFQLTVGTYARPGIPVASLIDTTRWRLVAAVPENWLKKIHPGDEVYFSLRNYPGCIVPPRWSTSAAASFGARSSQW